MVFQQLSVRNLADFVPERHFPYLGRCSIPYCIRRAIMPTLAGHKLCIQCYRFFAGRPFPDRPVLLPLLRQFSGEHEDAEEAVPMAASSSLLHLVTVGVVCIGLYIFALKKLGFLIIFHPTPDLSINTVSTVDAGTHKCKVGFAGHAAPLAVVPSVLALDEKAKWKFGEAVLDDDKIPSQSLSYPIERGIVQDWNWMQQLYAHLFDEHLNVLTEDYRCVLLSENPFCPEYSRETELEVMFMVFHANAVFFMPGPILSLHSTGIRIGVAGELGHAFSYIVPIYDLVAKAIAATQLELAGTHIDELLDRLLTQAGHNQLDLRTIRHIKEKLAYVAPNYAQERNRDITLVERRYRGLTGQDEPILIGEERFRCAEVLFQPSFFGANMLGLVDSIFESIQKCDIDTRKELYANIALGGGTALLPGLASRLKHDLSLKTNCEVNVLGRKKYDAWIGGSMMAQMDGFEKRMITREEFDEHGHAIVLDNVSNHFC